MFMMDPIGNFVSALGYARSANHTMESFDGPRILGAVGPPGRKPRLIGDKRLSTLPAAKQRYSHLGTFSSVQ